MGIYTNENNWYISRITFNKFLVTRLYNISFIIVGVLCSYLTNTGLHVAACAECRCWQAWHSAADIVYLVVWLPNSVPISPRQEWSLNSTANFITSDLWYGQPVRYHLCWFHSVTSALHQFFHAAHVPRMIRIFLNSKLIGVTRYSARCPIHGYVMIQVWNHFVADLEVLYTLDLVILWSATTICLVHFRINSRQISLSSLNLFVSSY